MSSNPQPNPSNGLPAPALAPATVSIDIAGPPPNQVLNYVPRLQPPFLPRSEEELNEANGIESAFHHRWYDLPRRDPDAYEFRAPLEVYSIGRAYGHVPEILELNGCQYVTPQIFNFRIKGLNDTAKYVVGLRFNSGTNVTLNLDATKWTQFCHDGGLTSMEVKKGPYEGALLNKGVIHFNDIVLGGCFSVQQKMMSGPNVILLTPERVYIPWITVIELDPLNPAPAILQKWEIQIPEMSILGIQHPESYKTRNCGPNTVGRFAEYTNGFSGYTYERENVLEAIQKEQELKKQQK